ncbi:MAG: hypothetical protein PHF00_10075 [Elusimicrobia bacterium]|nr:hypothetical protein [Elusimicrobiota bacterium]
MNRVNFIAGLLLLAAPAPAHALFTDDATQAMMLAEQRIFHAFMKVQVVQQLITLKQNYDASVRYFNEFKQLNSGRGLFQNLATQIKTAQTQQLSAMQQEINQSFAQSYNTNTSVDKFFKSLDQGIANNIKYVGDEIANAIENRKTGQKIADNAAGLSPRDAANLGAKAQGIQVQVLTQIHEDMLRLLQLGSMQLAGQARREKSESEAISGLRQSLKSRAPSYRYNGQGGAQ